MWDCLKRHGNVETCRRIDYIKSLYFCDMNCAFVGCNKNYKRCTVHALEYWWCRYKTVYLQVLCRLTCTTRLCHLKIIQALYYRAEKQRSKLFELLVAENSKHYIKFSTFLKLEYRLLQYFYVHLCACFNHYHLGMPTTIISCYNVRKWFNVVNNSTVLPAECGTRTID